MKPFVRRYFGEEQLRSFYTRLVRGGLSEKSAKEQVDRLRADIVWGNGEYQVNVEPWPMPEGWPEMVHLSIKRMDKAPVHDWRVFQQIKNMILSPEHEAVELYPADSRLVDGANQYHLWAFASTEHKWPFGYQERLVGTQKDLWKSQDGARMGRQRDPVE